MFSWKTVPSEKEVRNRVGRAMESKIHRKANQSQQVSIKHFFKKIKQQWKTPKWTWRMSTKNHRDGKISIMGTRNSEYYQLYRRHICCLKAVTSLKAIILKKYNIYMQPYLTRHNTQDKTKMFIFKYLNHIGWVTWTICQRFFLSLAPSFTAQLPIPYWFL